MLLALALRLALLPPHLLPAALLLRTMMMILRLLALRPPARSPALQLLVPAPPSLLALPTLPPAALLLLPLVCSVSVLLSPLSYKKVRLPSAHCNEYKRRHDIVHERGLRMDSGDINLQFFERCFFLVALFVFFSS